MPTTEDKVLQRAVAMILEPIYEEEFYDFSYGFRPGRSPHQALEQFWKEAMGLGVSWVLEVDLRKYFDSVNRSKLLELLGERMGDGVLLRLVSKWLHAGVMEEGQLRVCGGAGGQLPVLPGSLNLADRFHCPGADRRRFTICADPLQQSPRGGVLFQGCRLPAANSVAPRLPCERL